jgi:hypothetical protein
VKLETSEYNFKLLTPCFSGTAWGKDGPAEMRVPPIRGHIRFWHRTLFNTDSANRIWGSASNAEGMASKVAVGLIGNLTASAEPTPVLPHKSAGRGSRSALSAGGAFAFHLQRLVGCTDEDWRKAKSATQLWLVVGCIGLRSNRAAGSVWPEGQWVPKTADDLKQFLNRLAFRWTVALVGEASGKSPDELRKTASDTVRGNPVHDIFGGIKPYRQPSPTKFKVVHLSSGYCILAIAPEPQILQSAEQQLRRKQNAQRWQALGVWNRLLL